jgi:hypothetical protein
VLEYGMAIRRSRSSPEHRLPKRRGAPGEERQPRSVDALDDILVARQPLVGMLQQDIEQLLGATLTTESGRMPPLTLEGA